MSAGSIFSADMADWAPISSEIWAQKYQLKDANGRAVDRTWSDTVDRVARAAASVEPVDVRARWARAFGDVISDFQFIPGGRILAGAGSGRQVTLFNCFVMGRIEDDLGSIFNNVKEAALTLQMGGGIGHDFSTLRPRGAVVRSIGADASGPVSFMDVWDSMCRTIMSAGARRGAMMATLRCDHPDIELFIDAKREVGRLRNFNVSVLMSDAFVGAVRNGEPWPLQFEGKVVRTVDARALWDRLMRATYDVAEPGVIFIDRVNARNNLSYCETISATNPCGEQPLPPYGACLLGAINLAAFVKEPFTAAARLDVDRLRSVAGIAVRFLDNIIDVSAYPLAAQDREAKAKRRLGLGVTGLGDALVLLGLRYGSADAVALTGAWMRALKEAAYETSVALARDKGAFPLSDGVALAEASNISVLSEPLVADIARHGLRNGCLTTIAPTGTTSLLAGNVSSGIEPVFALTYSRRVLSPDGSVRTERVDDLAYRYFIAQFGASAPLTDAFVVAETLSPRAHLEMQAAAQAHVDSAISKTINVAEGLPFAEFKSVYMEAHELGLKGCTTYRPNATTGAVMVADTAPSAVAVDAAPAEGTSGTGARGDGVPARGVATGPEAATGFGPGSGREPRAGGVVYMAKPLERDPVLEGFTYKLRWPRSEHAIYITINDIEVDGRRRPFEIFINSKNLDHYAWTVGLTRMMSAVFRRGGDVSFVVEELRAVFDPQGGAWMEGRYVPSLLSAIGDVIDRHLKRAGRDLEAGADDREKGARVVVMGRETGGSGGPGHRLADAVVGPVGAVGPVGPVRPDLSHARSCPKCGRPTFQRIGGCWSCITCQYSQCD